MARRGRGRYAVGRDGAAAALEQREDIRPAQISRPGNPSQRPALECTFTRGAQSRAVGGRGGRRPNGSQSTRIGARGPKMGSAGSSEVAISRNLDSGDRGRTDPRKVYGSFHETSRNFQGRAKFLTNYANVWCCILLKVCCIRNLLYTFIWCCILLNSLYTFKSLLYT